MSCRDILTERTLRIAAGTIRGEYFIAPEPISMLSKSYITPWFNTEGKEETMRSLYKVYIVDPRKLGKLLAEVTVIAETEEQALLKAGVAELAKTVGLEIEQVDTYSMSLGSFIRPRRETRKVEIVKDED